MKEVKLTDGEKLILLMLSEIYDGLKIKGEMDTKLLRSAIFRGNLWGLRVALPGIFDPEEPAPEMVSEVVDVMDMWNFIERAYENLSDQDKARLEKEAEPFGKYVPFAGFDSNREAEYNCIARFWIDDLDRFERFKGRELNSHVPIRAAYRRMLSVFEPIRRTLMDADLTVHQLIEILREKVHPERRVAGLAN